jgi:GxGxDxHG motif protein
MPRIRCITEMGMGVEVHRRDATKAVKRAVSDEV